MALNIKSAINLVNRSNRYPIRLWQGQRRLYEFGFSSAELKKTFLCLQINNVAIGTKNPYGISGTRSPRRAKAVAFNNLRLRIHY